MKRSPSSARGVRATNRRWDIIRAAGGCRAIVGAIAIVSVAARGQPPEAAENDAMTNPAEHRHTNQLIHATSPYLLQHAHNPVDWFEWGDESLKKARDEDKPIFLSIGYSACHWCHVMEHESFENEGIAGLLNASFVSIKVDREERPDIDEIYMQATMRMTGHGGWPMSVFITPDGKPFFTGTYFPRPQFERALTQIAELWKTDRNRLLESGEQMSDYLSEWAGQARAGDAAIDADAVDRTARMLVGHFDMTDGGLSSDGNKFPPSMAMELMLRVHRRKPDSRLIDAVKLTLSKMARGGIYDHLAGGICRYSTDPQWLVPHFEKMLYDQALVGAIYVDAFQMTGEPLFRETARGIFDYVLRDLQSPEGGFYSTRDADSEGMEGKYYIWTIEQAAEVLGDDDARLFCSYYDVTESGNWFESRGHAPPGAKNILNVQRDVETVAKLNGIDSSELGRRLQVMRGKMLASREKRVPPGLDDKILTEWNGLMIAALAKGAQAFDEPRYAESAARAADFVLKQMRADGRLLRSHRQGRSRLTGYLTDYAFFVEGLLYLYEATFDPRWIREAVALTDDMISRYADNEHGGFFMTATDGEKLIVRTKDASDGAIPSGNSVAALNLLRLAVLVHKPEYRERAESVFRAFAAQVGQSPAQFERMLCAADFYHAATKEIAVVGAPDAPQTRAMLRAVHEGYRPNKVVTFAADESSATAVAGQLPLLRGKKRVDGKPTGYVCRGYVCTKPATGVAEFVAALNADGGS